MVETEVEKNEGEKLSEESSQPAMQGLIIGERFKVHEAVEPLEFGQVYRANDQKTDRDVELLVISSHCMPNDRARVKADLAQASQLIHKNIGQTFASGFHGGKLFAAMEPRDGRGLDRFMDRTQRTGKPIKLRQFFHLFAHVCNGLQYARGICPHGALVPSNVKVLHNGRIKIFGFGFSGLKVPPTEDGVAESQWDEAVRVVFSSSDDPAQRDILSVGMLMGQLLTGKATQDEFMGELEDELRDLIGRCLDTASEAALVNPGDLKRELLMAVNTVRSRQRTSSRSEPISQLNPKAPPPLPPSLFSDDELEVAPAQGGLIETAVNMEALSPATFTPAIGDDETRWLIHRDGIDYGPFTKGQVIEELANGTTVQNLVVDVVTGVRQPLVEHEEFESEIAEFLSQQAIAKAEAETAMRQAKRKERRRIQYMVVAGACLGVSAIYGAWMYQQHSLPESARAELGALLEPVQNTLPKITIVKPEPELVPVQSEKSSKAAVKSRRAGKRGRKSVADESGSIDMTSGPISRFDRKAFDKIVSSRAAKLNRCLVNEVKKRPSLKSLEVTFTVLPIGRLVNVKMPTGSKRGNQCVRSVFDGATVPPFDGTKKKITLPFEFQ